LTTAGLASINFSQKVTKDDFIRLIRAFTVAGSKAQDVAKQIKETFGDSPSATIRINEVKFIAADPSTGEVSIAAQIAAQTLGPEFKQWLNEPQKLLQLIAAAEGAKSVTDGGTGTVTVPIGSVPNVHGSAGQASGGGPGGGGPGGGNGTEGGSGIGGGWSGGVVPLQEEEVIQAI